MIHAVARPGWYHKPSQRPARPCRSPVQPSRNDLPTVVATSTVSRAGSGMPRSKSPESDPHDHINADRHYISHLNAGYVKGRNFNPAQFPPTPRPSSSMKPQRQCSRRERPAQYAAHNRADGLKPWVGSLPTYRFFCVIGIVRTSTLSFQPACCDTPPGDG